MATINYKKSATKSKIAVPPLTQTLLDNNNITNIGLDKALEGQLTLLKALDPTLSPITHELLEPKQPKIKPTPKKPFIGKFDQSMLEEMAEFDKRYKGTYLFIKFPLETKSNLYFCTSVRDDHIEVLNNKDTYIKIAAHDDVEIEIKWPEVGYFNHENHAYYTYRIPDRQWKRGPCSKNMCVVVPVKTLFKDFNIPNNSFDDVILTSAFAGDKTNGILAAIELLKNSKVSGRAINNLFAVTLPPYNLGGYLLWYNLAPVAVIKPKSKTIYVNYKYVMQEIKDYNRDYEDSKWTILLSE